MPKKGAKAAQQPAEPKEEEAAAEVAEAEAAPAAQAEDKPAEGTEEAAASNNAEPTEDAFPVDQELAAAALKYDISSKLMSYLDHHLMLKLLDFLKKTGMYKTEDMVRAELAVANETKIVDSVEDFRIELNEPVDDIAEWRQAVLAEKEHKAQGALPFLTLIESDDFALFKNMCEKKVPVEEIYARFNLEPDIMEKLLKHAKMEYETGFYYQCYECLKYYRMLQDSEPPVHRDLISAMWGQLASGALTQGGLSDVEDLGKVASDLDEMLEKGINQPKQVILVQKRWLLHWSLFCIFPQKQAGDRVSSKLLDLLTNEKSLSIISISCPWLFRYVGACLILNKLKNQMKDTVAIIRHEEKVYSDPVTRFLLALYVDMDFDEAQRELTQCRLVCHADYFLYPHWREFEENARLLIFETYCRIHQCINIEMIASKLNMEAEEAELWIVKLIQSAKLDARIDSEKKRVVMSKAPPSVYQQVIEKTKNLVVRRSTMILSNLEKREK